MKTPPVVPGKLTRLGAGVGWGSSLNEARAGASLWRASEDKVQKFQIKSSFILHEDQILVQKYHFLTVNMK